MVSDCRQWGPLVKAVAVPSTRASFGPIVTPALLTGMRDVTFRQASPPGASSQGDHRYYWSTLTFNPPPLHDLHFIDQRGTGRVPVVAGWFGGVRFIKIYQH